MQLYANIRRIIHKRPKTMLFSDILFIYDL